MPVTTVTVTINLEAMTGEAVEGAVVTATMDKNDRYSGGEIIATTTTATTNASGVATMDLFPNALDTDDPPGLGTTGSVYRFVCRSTGGKKFDVQATIPNQNCNLHDVVLAEGATAAAGAIAGAIRWNVAQTLTANEKDVARKNVGMHRAAAVTTFSAVGLVTGDKVFFEGRAAAGDGGGGWFTYNSASSQTADSGTVFTPTAGGGRLFRDGWTALGFSGQAVHSKWFGVKGDGVTSDSAAIQLASTSLAAFGGGKVLFDEGTHIITTSVLFQGRTVLQGVDKFSTIFYVANNAIGTHGNNGYVFDTQGFAGCQLLDLQINGNWANQGIAEDADTDIIGFLVRGSTDCASHRCYYKNMGKDGICAIKGSGGAIPKNLTITDGNLFESCRREGVTIVSGHYVTVMGNIFRNGYDLTNVVHNGALICEPDDGTDSIRSVIFMGNHVADMQAGVQFHNWPESDVSGLICSKNVFSGITEQAAVSLVNLAYGAQVDGNEFYTCGKTSATANESTKGGALYAYGSDYFSYQGNTAHGCRGARATMYCTNGGVGAQVKDNTHVLDYRRGVEFAYPSTAVSSYTGRQIVGNTLLTGGQQAANTYEGILIGNALGVLGGGDFIDGNTVPNSTTNGYATSLAMDYDAGTSIVGTNVFSGTGTATAFTNGEPIQEYESYSAPSTACTGALTNSIVYTLTKARDVVTLFVPQIVGTTTDVRSIALGATLPTRFRPGTNHRYGFGVALVNNATTSTACVVEVATTGIITIYRDAALASGGTWGTANNTGPLGFTLSWKV